MKKIFLFTLAFLLLSSQTVLARSGCCSHHGGVRFDGCGCNDGTPLSAKCAPYYVCQNSSRNNIYNPTPTLKPRVVQPKTYKKYYPKNTYKYKTYRSHKRSL